MTRDKKMNLIITLPLSLSEKKSNNLVHLDFFVFLTEIFSDAFFQYHSRALRLGGQFLCLGLFRSPHSSLAGFRSGLWLNHSKALIFLGVSHSWVDVDASFGT